MQLINIFGLVLNIIGVGMLFYHGMPPKYNQGYVEDMPSNEYNRSKRYSNIAFILIIAGFISQFISACIPLFIC